MYLRSCFIMFQNAKEPKATINLSELNVCLSPSKMSQENGLQLSYMCDGSTRHIYVYHESGETIIHWYTAIRSIKLNWLMVAYPSASAEEASIIILLFFRGVLFEQFVSLLDLFPQFGNYFYMFLACIQHPMLMHLGKRTLLFGFAYCLYFTEDDISLNILPSLFYDLFLCVQYHVFIFLMHKNESHTL